MASLSEATLTVLVTPSESLPGQWVAHCLNIDVVTQGESIQHAFMMAQEAVSEVVADDLEHGRDPLKRGSAPEEDWALVFEAQRRGRPLAAVKDQSTIKGAVALLQVLVPTDALPDHARPAEVEMLPPAWQIAALRDFHDSRPHS